MAKLTGLFQRGGSYYLRIVLPQDHPLKSHYRNGRWVQTLGPCSHREAVRLGTVRRAEVLHGITPQPAATLNHSAPIPEAPRTPNARKTHLRDVFLLWKAAKVRSADSVGACERALALFEQHSGNPPIEEITRAQGDAFRAHLLAQSLSSKTKHDRMTWAKSLLKYACRDLELIPRNPWEGLDVDHATEKRRSPWTEDQLKAFFGMRLFANYDLPTQWRGGGAAAYWIPLLGLYSGARVGELCQLRVQDVQRDSVGAFIKISEEAEGATVKTEAGLRSVPVHSELIRLGFLDYVDGIRGSGTASLWPALKLRKGRPGAYFSDWFGTFRKSCRIAVPDFHSLRHTVRTAMTEAGISESVQDRITGHEVKGSTGTRVYAHPKAILRHAIEALRYPSIDLRRVSSPRGVMPSPRGVQA